MRWVLITHYLQRRPRADWQGQGAVRFCRTRFRWRTQMDEQRKYAILFAATVLAARKLNETGVKPCPARECAIADAIVTGQGLGDRPRPAREPRLVWSCR